MSLFNPFTWFTPKNKHNVVLPTIDSSKLLHGLDLVHAFTTETEPKVVNFPRDKYSVYWETILGTIEGGYVAHVRFYPFDGGQIVEKTLTNTNVEALKDKVNSLILQTMAQNKR